jgi:hypothetical protein
MEQFLRESLFFLPILSTQGQYYMVKGNYVVPSYFTHIIEIAYFKT